MAISYYSNYATIISNNIIIINGRKLPNCPGIGNDTTIIGDKVFKNG